MQSTSESPETESVWKQIAPLLEDAMARLAERDRSLVALRYFENKTGAEIAALTGAHEWAIRKRTERAVEKLRIYFSKRGIALSAAILTAAVSANSVHAAPAGLANAISAAAVAKGAAASTSTLTLAKGAMKLMAWTKTKTAVVAGIGILLSGGMTVLILAERTRLEYQRNPVAYEISHERPVTSENDLRNQLVGTWGLFAAKDWGATNFIYFPTNSGHLKIFTLTNSTTLFYDADSNVIYSISGKYALRGNIYTESLESATGPMARFRGQRVPFKIRVDGNKYYQMGFGKNPHIEEIWERILQ